VGEGQGHRSTTGEQWGIRVARAASRVRTDLSLAIIEGAVIVVAYAAALSIRFLDASGAVPEVWWTRLGVMLPLIIGVHIGANVLFGNYGHVWRYASVEEAVRLAGASLAAGATLLVLVEGSRWTDVWDGVRPLPLSVLVIGVLLTLGGMGALRFWSRLFSFRRMREAGGYGERALVVGVGEEAVHLARHRSVGSGGIFVVGFVDPGAERPDMRRRLAGLPVLGAVDDVPRLVSELDIDQVVIADGEGSVLARRLIDLCLDVEVRLRILPAIDAVLAARGGSRDIRDLRLCDLLERGTVQTDLAQVAQLVAGKTVLVTGAGGSIGSELVRQVIGFSPEQVVALDHDETHLHDALSRWEGDVAVRLELADVRDEPRIRAVFARYRPDVVFHAAAHKHVPILERCPDEAAKTNVLGTEILVRAAVDHAAEQFVLISTDKAVNPTSIMGASKRLAEMLVQVESRRVRRPRFSAVRFGNVLGSRGSVVPTFTRQIQAGGPVTVSHPSMERYFMTVDEAVQLVLQAAALSEGGEVFVLDMGDPVRILDLAHRLIRLAGLVPGKDIAVEITGIRPGERFSEQLAVEPLEPTTHGKILMARPTPPGAATMYEALAQIESLLADERPDELAELLLDMARARWAGTEVVDLRPVVGYPGVPIAATGDA